MHSFIQQQTWIDADFDESPRLGAKRKSGLLFLYRRFPRGKVSIPPVPTTGSMVHNANPQAPSQIVRARLCAQAQSNMHSKS